MEVIFHPDYIEHRQPGKHPERPERLTAILDTLEETGSGDDIEVPERAVIDDLSMVHSSSYIERNMDASPHYIDGGDTYLGEDTHHIALLAAGGALLSLSKALKGHLNIALLRPPGHHAGRDYGGGFCYYNNIALAAQTAELDRVVVLDFDAHHGNGTSDIFYSDPSVLYISLHHHGIYPGTGESVAVGEDEGEGYNINFPMRTGMGDSTADLAWKQVISPVLHEYEPGLILVSFGTDGHYMDPMTGLTLSSQCYVRMAKRSIQMADELCGGNISFMLEGGYHLGSLSEIINGVVSLDRGRSINLEFTDVADDGEAGRRIIEETKEAVRRYWDAL